MLHLYLSDCCIVIVVHEKNYCCLVLLFQSVWHFIFAKHLYSVDNRTPTPTPTPQIVDLGSFRVTIPPGWRYEPQSGVDSIVGAFVGDGITLLFDYGYYSNPLPNEYDAKYTISYETIDGRKAKMVQSKIPGKGLIGVYYD
jgi:hypothetical protein